MYIDYNTRIKIIALYLNRYKYRFILRKYILIYKLNKFINYYNNLAKEEKEKYKDRLEYYLFVIKYFTKVLLFIF